MENQLVGIIGSLMVAFALLLIFVVGVTTIVKRMKEYNQHRTESYITTDQAKKFLEENIAIKSAIKGLQKKATA